MIRGNPLFKSILSAAVGVALLATTGALAQSSISPSMTQVELIQWLVQMSGDTVEPAATPDTFITWAKSQGITPVGGWRANEVLTRDVLAQVLVQYFNFNVKKGSDPLRTLQREGLYIPGSSDSAQISRTDFAATMDDPAFNGKVPTWKWDVQPHSRHNPPKDHGNNGNHNGWNKPPPPGNPPGKHPLSGS
jgi:hypothetical protein